MSDFDFHPVVLGADSTDLKAGTTRRIFDAMTKGTTAAAASGVLSIANTFRSYVGADQLDTEQTLRRFSNSIGDYYSERKDALDLVGFVGTSILPGGLAIKGVQMARSGNALGSIGRGLGYTSSRKNEYLQRALQETAEGGGVVKRLLTRNRLQHLKWEAADQMILGTAFELGVLATMHASPVFDDWSAKDWAWNFGLGIGLSGAIGGPLGSIGAKGILNQASKEISKEMRMFDVVSDAKGLGLSPGTDALLMAESIALLPQTYQNLPFSYRAGGQTHNLELNISGALASARMNAEKLGNDKLALKFNELAGGDERIGQAIYSWFQEATIAGRQAGLAPSEIIQRTHGYLNQLKAVGRLDIKRMELDQRKFYARAKPFDDTVSDRERLLGMFSEKRTRDTFKTPYALADDVTSSADLTVRKFDELGAANLREAWRAFPDTDVIRMADGSVRVNPLSKKIIKLRENPVEHKMFVRLDTGDLSTEVVPTFGDIIAKGKMKFDIDYIRANADDVFKQAASQPLELGMSPLVTSSRYAWASQLTPQALRKIIRDSVDVNDFPLMDRIQEMVASKELSLDTVRNFQFLEKSGGKTVERQFDDIVDFGRYIEQRKVQWLEEQLNGWDFLKQGSVPNSDILASHLNAQLDWVEEVIARGFKPFTTNETPAGTLLPTNAALQPKTVEFTWDFGRIKSLLPEEAYNMNMGPSHLATKELTKEYQKLIAKQQGENAFQAVMGDFYELFGRAADDLVRDTDVSGAGAHLVGAANAGYGQRAKLWAQDTGKNVAHVTQHMTDADIRTLSPHINAVRDNLQASAELGILTTALRKSPYRYVFDDEIPNRIVSLEAKAFARKNDVTIDEALEYFSKMEPGRSPHVFEISSDAVVDFMRTHSQINFNRQQKVTTLKNAAGLTRQLPDEPLIYTPPINTARYPYHAFVRTKEKIGLTSDVSMITARTEDELRALASKVGDDFDVFYKADTDMYYKIKGEYDYGRTLNDARVNSELARRGVLADFAPTIQSENILDEYLTWHNRQNEKLVRDAVQVRNRQFYSELEFLSEQYRKVSESVTRGIGSKFKAKVKDPFGDYIKTSLNISKQQEFSLLDSLNDFVDKVSLAAGDALERAFFQARRKQISWEEANKITDRYGLGKPYADLDMYMSVNSVAPRNLIREGLQKGNLALANLVLRLDFANSIINIISTPILLGTEMASIRRLIREGSEEAGALRELTSVKIPGHDGRVPTNMKLMHNGINNYFGANKDELIKRYRDIGAIKDVSTLYHQVLDDLSFRPHINPSKWLDRVNAGVERGAKIMGNTFSEEVTRFVSADAMRQLTDPLVKAGRMSIQEQNAYISTFVNRVQGNYVTSQRPIIFQGTSGAAISLFQTYVFNVLQQLHRHIQARDVRALATFAGLQTSVFGMNGLPMFEHINTTIIGNWLEGNPQHKDMYSTLPAIDKEMGNWILYGTASAFPFFGGQSPALYTRGDINPRHISVVPLNPLETPAIAASIRLAKAVMDTGKNMGGGMDASDALLQGLAHQGINRPLAGFAQLMAGQSTTSKGSLISAANDMETTSMLGVMADRMVNYGGVSRLMGARPMDEAVALNTIYRQKKYEALDRARIERLGRVVKSKLANNQMPTDEELEDFMLRYTRSGGRIENFSQAMQRWSRDANVSIVNQLAGRMHSPYAQTLQTIMGGEEIQDYRNR